MHRSTLYWRSAWFYRVLSAAVVLGVAAASGALSGALLVGDSMRASLRHLALDRLGDVEQALVAQRFFRDGLADGLRPEGPAGRSAPLVLATAALSHADSGAHAERVNLIGVDERFWKMSAAPGASDPTAGAGRLLVLNEPLARQLGARVGDDLLVRAGRPAAISPETVLGRRDRSVLSSRLTVHAVIPAEGLGGFTLEAGQPAPMNAYMALPAVQRWLDQPGRANAVVMGGGAGVSPDPESAAALLQQRLQSAVRLEDLGLRVRRDEARGYLALESDAFLIEPAVEEAARLAADAAGVQAGGVLVHLANTIRVPPPAAAPGLRAAPATTSGDPPPRVIPYSVVCALDASAVAGAGLTLKDGSPVSRIEPGTVLLNDWAAEALAASPGDRLEMDYYVTGQFGELQTETASWTLAGVVPLAGAAADPGFTPNYPGVTDARRISDWDPPFPIDLARIQDRDESYWEQHQATPKAFVSLEDGQRWWVEQPQRFGRLTSIRLSAGGDPAGLVDSAAAARFEQALLERIDAARLGLVVRPVRAQALKAASGSTDFGGLFIGFSMVLIGSAALLVVLLIRMGVERRSGEIGILLAAGFPAAQVRRLLLAEGLLLAGAGSALGVAASTGYAWLMLAGLRTWWSAAVRTPTLKLHVTATSLAIGGVASLLLAGLVVAVSLRGLLRLAPRALLAGEMSLGGRAGPAGVRRGQGSRMQMGIPLLGALVLVATPRAGSGGTGLEAMTFFGSGALLMIALLLWIRRRLYAPPSEETIRPGPWALLRLGARNARRHPGRSIGTIALLASAIFVIASLQTFRVAPPDDVSQPSGGTGGFALVAESSVPLLHDVNTAPGRSSLGFSPEASRRLQELVVLPFRLRPGDAASCRNLYRPVRPRIAGATPAMIERGGFRFSGVYSPDGPPPANPWTLLNQRLDDGAVPVIGDESAVRWQLHSGLGQDLVTTDDQGRSVRLRFVALLAGSVLQDELIVAEQRFAELFPGRSGYSFFLIQVEPQRAAEAAVLLERELAPYGFDARLARERLEEYSSVQNTYLSTFQTLGGFGLVLGTLGLGAVMLRGVWERRSEWALMRAVGFGRRGLGLMVLAECGLLVAAGLAAGGVPAAVAVAPHALGRADSIPWGALAATVGAVVVIGLASGAVAAAAAFRAPLIPALRKE